MVNAQETVTLPKVFKGEQEDTFISCSKSLEESEGRESMKLRSLFSQAPFQLSLRLAVAVFLWGTLS